MPVEENRFLDRYVEYSPPKPNKGVHMWYILQAGIAIGVAYFWCTMPGNSFSEFGHGLFLGGILAWYITALISAFRDLRTTVEDQPKLDSSVVPSKDVPKLPYQRGQ